MGLSDTVREWIDSRENLKVSTELLISEIMNLKEKCIAFLQEGLKRSSPDASASATLLATLEIVRAMNPTISLTKTQKRAEVEKYILKSYPYWDKVNAQNPQKSVEVLMEQVKEEMASFSDLLTSLHSMSIKKLSGAQLASVCTLSQKVIAYSMTYVHIKRCPRIRSDGGTTYRKPDFCGVVDLDRWSACYGLKLD